MKIRCPKHKQNTCTISTNCCKNENTSPNTPVHEACDWFKLYEIKKIRKIKIDKLNMNF